MNITRKERELLNEMSKKVYGRPSYWRKMLDKGHLVPGMAAKSGTIIKRQEYFTLDEIKKKMQKTLDDIDEAQKKAEEKKVTKDR